MKHEKNVFLSNIKYAKVAVMFPCTEPMYYTSDYFIFSLSFFFTNLAVGIISLGKIIPPELTVFFFRTYFCGSCKKSYTGMDLF